MASSIQHSSPLDVVKAFIGSVRSKDLEYMHKLIHPQATACLIRANEPRFQPLAESLETLAKTEQEVVEASWDEVEHIDGEYATVWAKFSIHLDGRLHQLGSSSYSCWKSPLSGWIILTMSDIARSINDTSAS